MQQFAIASLVGSEVENMRYGKGRIIKVLLATESTLNNVLKGGLEGFICVEFIS